MAQKFYNVAKAAEVLGISPAEVNEMRETQQLHGYRDGADWKFKAEEVDELATSRTADSEDGEEDVLVTELELGLSDPGASGTVIGPPPANPEDEAGDEERAADAEKPEDTVDSAVNDFEELEFTFDDSQLDISTGGSSGSNKVAPPGSEIDLSADALDDDDLVLGGSGGGSELTLGGDSGISLIDPTDSGLSLEDPLDLADAGGDSLALADSGLNLDDAGSSDNDSLVLDDDSMLSLGESSSAGSSADAAGESDFTLTPMDEVLDDDSSQSDSQVIALDTDGEPDDLEEMPAMLDEEPSVDFGEVAESPLGDVPLDATADVGFGAAAVQEAAAVQTQGASTVIAEAPYSNLNIVSLGFCTFLLALVGMMMYDVMQNMWSWNGVSAFNSPLLDWLSSMLG